MKLPGRYSVKVAWLLVLGSAGLYILYVSSFTSATYLLPVRLSYSEPPGDQDGGQGEAETTTRIEDQVSSASGASVDQNVISRQASTHLTSTRLIDQERSTFIPMEPDTSPVRQPANIPTRFLIEEADYCEKRPGLQVIAYVHSAITRVGHRRDVRATWANASNYDLGDISVKVGAVFMVGRAKNEIERQIVQEESQRYHDIVQGDYGDHYRLLSYKGLASLYWINKHCSHVPWTLHSDDDTHIDIFLFYRALQELDDVNRKHFICSHMYGPALRKGRWRVRYEEYPAQNYPLYCSGGAWFLQTSFIPRLLEASKVVPFLWVDDTYITGLLAKGAGIKQLGFQDFYGSGEADRKVLGHQVVWFIKYGSRLGWWQDIVNYHRNHSMHNPVTLIPKGKVLRST
nr:beta-1,3-galactosyltransferase 1-like [Procambarus clarkii]